MTPFTQRFTALAVVLAATAGIAVAAPQDPSAGHGNPHRSMMKIDLNNDGVIDRAEADQHPRLAGKFDTLDQNKDGKLDQTERGSWKGKRGARGFGGGMGMGGMGMAHAAKLDADGDGRISLAEAATSAEIADKFAEIDLNRDGYIVRSELRSHHERLRPQREAERVKRLDERFAAADRNGDGKLSKIEVSEQMPHLSQAFAFMDEDRDGSLTRDDLQQTPRR